MMDRFVAGVMFNDLFDADLDLHAGQFQVPRGVIPEPFPTWDYCGFPSLPASIPPSIVSSIPVTYLDSADARYNAP